MECAECWSLATLHRRKCTPLTGEQGALQGAGRRPSFQPAAARPHTSPRLPPPRARLPPLPAAWARPTTTPPSARSWRPSRSASAATSRARCARGSRGWRSRGCAQLGAGAGGSGGPGLARTRVRVLLFGLGFSTHAPEPVPSRRAAPFRKGRAQGPTALAQTRPAPSPTRSLRRQPRADARRAPAPPAPAPPLAQERFDSLERLRSSVDAERRRADKAFRKAEGRIYEAHGMAAPGGGRGGRGRGAFPADFAVGYGGGGGGGGGGEPRAAALRWAPPALRAARRRPCSQARGSRARPRAHAPPPPCPPPRPQASLAAAATAAARRSACARWRTTSARR